MTDLLFTKVRDVKSPAVGTGASAGVDFFVPNDFPVTNIAPGEMVKIPLGIHVKFPTGIVMLAWNKSGVSTKLRLEYTAGCIDADYQGEIILPMKNVGTSKQTIYPGDKIIQFLFVPFISMQPVIIDNLETLYPQKSERGDGGFGSTGTR